MSANCEEQPTSSTPQTIQLAGIVNDSITDGPGIRLTVFVQGCPHHCPGCHNQQTWDFAGGQPTTTEEIWQQIQQNPLLSGVTFSGGSVAVGPANQASRAGVGHLHRLHI